MADEVVRLVRNLDGYNRHRFASQPDLLAAWTAASNVIGPPATGGLAGRRTEKPSQTSPATGPIQPAA